MTLQEIQPRFVEKVWGSTQLEPWFPNPAQKIGEVWFPFDDLLIKFLFTTEHLSVQVHPNDEYAAVHEDSRGKTEMWYILRAEPDAKVALGFKEPVGKEALAEAARSGEVMEQLNWVAAKPGDTFFTPAGTVHAIGAGLALCEIQQNSDVTYRIFDFGRPRELHLERAMDVSHFGTHPGASESRNLAPGHDELAGCEYFVTERIESDKPCELTSGAAIVLEGTGTFDGLHFRPGTVWNLGSRAVSLHPETPYTLLLTGHSKTTVRFP